ncbi:barstar family protein [Xaviernesmea oryzae]|uniref:barstar family protein n=1 Tax=Xaviernesmea oryzae TaxID=464029 RepID=UPI0009FADFB1|nr:barstar family protein [Xaviernesmea oryzae]
MFYETLDDVIKAEAFTIFLRKGLMSKSEILQIFAEQAQFPGHFGMNWDAFEECILDLSWIGPHEVRIIHEDIPMGGDFNSAKIYINIISEASAYWNSTDPSSTAKGPGHKLEVFFPTEIHDEVNKYLDSSH